MFFCVALKQRKEKEKKGSESNKVFAGIKFKDNHVRLGPIHTEPEEFENGVSL